MRIVVTGGTGHLGRSIVAQLIAGGHQVRVLARQPGEDAAIEWVRGDLGTGEGVVEAVTGMGTVVHAATNSPAARRGSFRPTDFVQSPTEVDVDGTRALLAAAADASVEHFIHVSIVGLEHMARLPYSRVKLRAEELGFPARLERALEAGNTSPHARRGTTTWDEWLRRSTVPPADTRVPL